MEKTPRAGAQRIRNLGTPMQGVKPRRDKEFRTRAREPGDEMRGAVPQRTKLPRPGRR